MYAYHLHEGDTHIFGRGVYNDMALPFAKNISYSIFKNLIEPNKGSKISTNFWILSPSSNNQ